MWDVATKVLLYLGPAIWYRGVSTTVEGKSFLTKEMAGTVPNDRDNREHENNPDCAGVTFPWPDFCGMLLPKRFPVVSAISGILMAIASDGFSWCILLQVVATQDQPQAASPKHPHSMPHVARGDEHHSPVRGANIGTTVVLSRSRKA